MKSVTSEVMRELDRKSSAEFDIPGEELMRRAGRGVAAVVEYFIERVRLSDPVIQFIAGRGNNGGDAFAAATCLHEHEFEVEVLLAGAARDVHGDALKHLGKMRAAGVPLHELPTKEDWEDAVNDTEGVQIVVDAVLGIGVKGPPRGPVASAIHYINSLSESCYVIAIDVPSGLDADTGASPGEAVTADVTVTIGLPKTGLLLPAAVPYVGNMELVQIGIPLDLVRALPAERELITDWDLRQMMPRRPRQSHKGNFGHVLVFGGAAGYAGAPAMAAGAALRSGAGLVSVVVPRSVAAIVANFSPEIMTHGAPETAEGSLSLDAWTVWGPRLGSFSAVVAGPGMTRSADTFQLVCRLLAESPVPLVLDADALNVLKGKTELLATAVCPVVITPHPGELARLLGCTTDAIQSDRESAVRRAAELTGATVVLKGAGTLVMSKDHTLAVNLTGNPGMATGGMGDVLAGLIGALLAQGLRPYEAACAGVYVHGRAGDSVAWRKSQRGITAGDVIEELPYVFREVLMR